MSYAVELNGVRVEAETEQEARKELRKLARAAKKAEAERSARYQLARLRGEALAYRVLSRKAGGEAACSAWRLYLPSDKWSQHLYCVPTGEQYDYIEKKHGHIIKSEHGDVLCSHYGHELVGGVCGGAGYCWLVFLKDGDAEPACFAVGVDGDQIALVDCPGITVDYFRRAEPAAAADVA